MRRSGLTWACWWFQATVVAGACSVLALATTAAAAAPQVQMAQATLVLPLLGNASEVPADRDVLVSVQLLGGAAKPVTANLSLLLPPGDANASDRGSSSSSSDSDSRSTWAPADPNELWLEPRSVSWSAGEPASPKHVRLRSAAELEYALHAPRISGTDSNDAGSSTASITTAGQPLLRVQLVAASGAAIDMQRSSTTLVLQADGEEEGASIDTAAGPAVEPEPANLSLPLFGFIANQAAYPPVSSNGSSNGSRSSIASIPVRLLAGQLRENATLKYVVRLNGTAAGASAARSRQQFLLNKVLIGFLYFKPPAAAAATGDSGAAEKQEQRVQLQLAWDCIPPEAEYRLGLELQPIYNARVQPQPDAVALHVFGTPLGTCPPGSAVRANGSSPGSSNDNGLGDDADFGPFHNGSVIDLSSSLAPNTRDYAAMVESDVSGVTLCLRDSAQVGNGSGLVQVVPAAAGKRRATAALRPASAAVAESACGCEGSDGALGGDGLTLSSIDASSSGAESFGIAEDEGSSACTYTAWVLPLQTGQNEFTVTLPVEQGSGLAPAPMAEHRSSSTTTTTSIGNREQYKLAVVRLADPEHAELESIAVKSSDGTAVLLCGPSNSGGRSIRKLPSRATLDTATGDSRGSVTVPMAPKPCRPGKLLTLDVSDCSRLISVTPVLRQPDVAGVRVEVNGQVLSRGGDVVADQLEDTTAAQQQRSNVSFLPSAFIMGLLPGSRMEAEVVVVAEDGVTARRYPLQFTVVAGGSGKQHLAVTGSKSGTDAAGASNSMSSVTGASPRQHGWPPSPATQPTCMICPAGWAADAVNSTACHMCRPGSYSPAEQSPSCLSCGPGTFAYSWGSAYCKNCIEGTHAPTANSSLCLPCPANTTTRKDGQSTCDVPLVPGSYQAPRYAVVVSFWVLLTGVDPQDVVMRAGVNAAPEAIVTSLIRTDTAHQFNISIEDVQVNSIRQVARRALSVNVTAMLRVEVPAGATDEDIDVELEVERLSADSHIDMLSKDPTRFFGRTVNALEAQVESALQATTASKPGSTNTGLLLGMLIPGVLAILLGIVLVAVGCRKSRACAKWRGAAARRMATTWMAPRAAAYSRYSGSPNGSSTA